MATELVIESGLPIPPRRQGYVAVMHKMEIGDSVFLPVCVETANKVAHRILGKGNYTTRKGMGGVRVWRIR
jgi:hypothetical protein